MLRGVGKLLRCTQASTVLCAKNGGGVSTTVRNYTAPIKDMKFLINEVHNYPDHYKTLPAVGGEEASEDLVDSILEEAGKFASAVLAPLTVVGDSAGCTYVDERTTKTPPGFKEAYDQFAEGGWQGLMYPEKYGGQGLPPSLGIFQSDMFATANWTWNMYPGLSKGAINTIYRHGTEELKDKYLARLISGEHTGTMCLTEPQCGSDLGQVTTRAEPCGNGKYKITGTKIFISCGDHDMTENIIHCVLARLPDAPPGTKGISLFSVPKYLVNDDGSTGEFNNVNIGRIENKMGCHGSSTCEINFEDAVGELIGVENKGLNHMFTFINTSRLGCAIQGVAAAELSYQHSLPYAKERISMRALSGTKCPDKAADPIINHPGVRKLLLLQKAVAEGGRSMIYQCAKVADKMADAEERGDTKTAEAMDDKLGFLTPILKGFLTEMGLNAANAGIQVWGGHGFIKENFQEQIARDVRIASLWEGTTQIQGLDLLGRKVLLQKLKPLSSHASEMYGVLWGIITASSGGTFKRAATLLREVAWWQVSTMRLAAGALKDKESVGVASVDYLMYSGYVTLAYHWLLMEVAANKALAAGEGNMAEERGFYEAKLHMSEYVFAELLPNVNTLKKTMFVPTKSVMQMSSDSFSFDYARD